MDNNLLSHLKELENAYVRQDANPALEAEKVFLSGKLHTVGVIINMVEAIRAYDELIEAECHPVAFLGREVKALLDTPIKSMLASQTQLLKPKRKYKKRKGQKKTIHKNTLTGHGYGFRPNSVAHKVLTALVVLQEERASPEGMFSIEEIHNKTTRLGFFIDIDVVGKRLSQLKHSRKLAHSIPNLAGKAGTLLWGATPKAMKSIVAMGKARNENALKG